VLCATNFCANTAQSLGLAVFLVFLCEQQSF
jgi:hypothetical protein